MLERIDFNKVIQYSRKNCFKKSQKKCATYVKKAFEAGGCTYTSGDGWYNQNFCKTNGFKCIGDFVPIDNNPRQHGNIPIQFPEGYVQQVGDICLIQHGKFGHMVYAAGPTINDWVSDYWQGRPDSGQQPNTGPYCYTGGYERIQFWRHSSVIGNIPEVDYDLPLQAEEIVHSTSYSSSQTPKSISQRNKFTTSEDREMDFNGVLLGAHMRQS